MSQLTVSRPSKADDQLTSKKSASFASTTVALKEDPTVKARSSVKRILELLSEVSTIRNSTAVSSVNPPTSLIVKIPSAADTIANAVYKHLRDKVAQAKDKPPKLNQPENIEGFELFEQIKGFIVHDASDALFGFKEDKK